MTYNSDHLLSRDGLRLYYRTWLPDRCKKIVCIIHGLGEHSGRYDHIAQFLNGYSIGVFALDLRGHGKSKGKKGHAGKEEWLYNDIEELLKVARHEYLNLPIYLFGHSMGGTLVANFMLKFDSKEVAGFILSAPWFKLCFEPPPWKRVLGTFMARFWPSFTTSNGLNVNHISKIEAEVEKYKSDPLIHNQISAGLYELIVLSGQNALKKASEIKKKGLIYHGTQDHIIDLNASKAFAQLNKLFEWRGISGAFHEPHNDQEREEVMELIGKWITKN